MPETTPPDVYALLLDRLRHAIQYTEAAAVTLRDAIVLLEKLEREKADDA
jgi:hypothetical protein